MARRMRPTTIAMTKTSRLYTIWSHTGEGSPVSRCNKSDTQAMSRSAISYALFIVSVFF